MQIWFSTVRAPAKSEAAGARQPRVYPDWELNHKPALQPLIFVAPPVVKVRLVLVLCDASPILCHGFIIGALFSS